MKSPVIDKMREKMNNDKWHVKLHRWLRVDVYYFMRIDIRN